MNGKTKTDNLLEFWGTVMKPYLHAAQESINELKLSVVNQYISTFDLSKDNSKYVLRSLYNLHYHHSYPFSEFKFESIKEDVNNDIELSDNKINKGLENLIGLGLVIKKDNGKYVINPTIRNLEYSDIYNTIKEIAQQ